MSTKASDKTQTEKPQKLKCGLIMPIAPIDGCSESHWEEVRNIIKEALSDTDFDVELVSDSNEIGIIQNRIVTNIYKSDMIICDVSGKNPNVMFELGMRLAFDKPTLIIKDDKTNYSFDTAPIEHILYPRDLHYHSVLGFKDLLRTKFLATYSASLDKKFTTFLKHFGEFRVAEVSERTVNSETYILQELSELSASVRKIQSSLSKSPEYYSNPYSISSSSSTIDKMNAMVGYQNRLAIFSVLWSEYKQMHQVNNSILLNPLRFNGAVQELSDRFKLRYPSENGNFDLEIEGYLRAQTIGLQND